MKSTYKYLFFNILLILTLFYQISSRESTIRFPTETLELFYNENSPSYITIIMENYDELQNNYLHISTSSNNTEISPMIILSTFQSKPTINSSDIYSTQRVGDAHLYLGKDLLSKNIYLTIICNFYPCTYYLYLNMEQYPNLTPGETFSYFVKNNKNNNISFKIESQTTLKSSSSPVINKSAFHILTLAISF